MSDTPRTDEAAAQVPPPDKRYMEVVPADFARHLERELHAMTICAGVASKERGEWAAEREDLRTALTTLLRIARGACLRGHNREPAIPR